MRTEAKRGFGKRRHQQPMQVGPEEVELWRPKMRLHRRPERCVMQKRAVAPAQEINPVRQDAGTSHLGAEPEVVEQADSVRAQRKRRPNLCDRGCLLEDLDPHPPACQCDSRRQATHASTDDRHPHRRGRIACLRTASGQVTGIRLLDNECLLALSCATGSPRPCVSHH